jgi:hypothetical protein
MPFVRGHFRRTRSGFTFVRPSFRRSSGSGALAIAVLVLISLVVSVVLAIVRFVVEHWIYIAGTMAAGGAIALGVTLSRQLRERRIEAYLQLAREAVEGFEDRFEDLTRLARRLPTDDQRRTVGEEEIYRSFIAQILADGQVTDAEWARLSRVNELFAFEPQRALAIREEAFDGLMAWVGVDLSEAQEAAVRTVAARFALPPQHTEPQLAVVSARRSERQHQAAAAAERERYQAALAAVREQEAALEAEREREARLAAQWQRQVKLEAKLKRGESCWMAVEARLQDRKASRAGQLLVTNKRILFVSDSVVSVAFSQVLDIAADPDSGVLRLIKDGRKTPYEFLLEEPLVALAHVERSLDEA